jgi:kumamolisin
MPTLESARTVSTAYPKTATPASLNVSQVAAAYGFPTGSATGHGVTVGLIELGGGFVTGQLSAFLGFTPNLTAVPVGSGSNTPDNNGADGEVQSDIIMVAQVAPQAAIRVYFAGNDDDDFLAAITQALSECNVVSLSWGGPESSWDDATMRQFEAAIAAGKAKGVPFFVAAGDSGVDDGTGTPTVDFPASSPSSIAVGGTTLVLKADGTRALEYLWDDDPTSNATGGGVSAVFPGRIVPDIAGNADPDTGYNVSVDGQAQVIGGTSLPTPLFAGLYALLYELAAGPVDFLGLITTNLNASFDATLGRDTQLASVVGNFRVPNADVMATLVTKGVNVPVQPAPTPAPSPVPVGQPTSALQQLIAELESLLKDGEALLAGLQQQLGALNQVKSGL